LLEVTRAIRRTVAPGFAVAVKLNSADFQRGGFAGSDALEVIAALGEERVDLLEISGGTYERAVMFDERAPDTSTRREAFFLDFAEKARAATRTPLMLTGGFRTRAAMDAALASGAVDVIGMARPLAVEPELPAALLEGRSLGARSPRLATGCRTLDAIVTGSWHQQQLRRMGRGLEPVPSLSRSGALLLYVADALRSGRGGMGRARPAGGPWIRAKAG
jgi:2,4-dienoyl-CoA reductase-like NADH-dependent reductase (Old Yellow Enzyme family)